MIFDAFLFSGELDMLECRLTELDSLDCKFIIAEADITFQGAPKPLGYLENKERFAPWEDRIIYLLTVLPGIEDTLDPWAREYEMRSQLLEAALAHMKQSDIMIFGDVDEIPRQLPLTPGTVLGMDHHLFAVDWVHPQPWRGSVVTRSYGLKPERGRWLRDRRWAWPVIPHAGWHLSWLGGTDAAKRKAAAFSHAEFTGKVCKWLDEGHCLGDGLVWDDSQELNVQQVYSDIKDAPRWIREYKCPDEWFRW